MIDNNGNIKFFNMKDITSNLIETFVKLFGEDNREHITNIINNTEIFTFHTFEFINKKYIEKIKEYDNEIIEEFYKISGLKKNEEIDFCLRLDKSGNNKLEDEVYYHGQVLNILNREPADYELYEDICVAFDIHDEEPIRREKLNDIYRMYKQAVKSIEKKHDCELFQDIEQIERNLTELSCDFIKVANSLEIISDEDYERVKEKDFDYFDLTTLDCHGKLFNFDMRISGFENSFLYDDESGKIGQLLYIVNSGAELEYMDIKTLEQMWSGKYKNISLLEKEYKYQKKNNSAYFIEKKDVLALREFRNNAENFINKNCKFALSRFTEEEIDESFHSDFYVSNYFKSDCLDYPKYRMMLSCDDTLSNYTFISNIIHEFMHNMGFFNSSDISNKMVFRQDGVNIRKHYIDKDRKIIKTTQAYDTTICEEYCNERLAQIAKDIYIENFGVPQLLEDGGKDWDNCLYDFYHLLYGDFFELFKEDIIKTKMHNKNFFANKNYPDDIVEKFIAKIDSKFGRLLKTNLDGVVNTVEYIDLVSLEPEYTKILKKIKRKTNFQPNDLFDEDFLQSTLSPRDYIKLIEIIKEKNKIICNMAKDKSRSVKTETKDYEKER